MENIDNIILKFAGVLEGPKSLTHIVAQGKKPDGIIREIHQISSEQDRFTRVDGYAIIKLIQNLASLELQTNTVFYTDHNLNPQIIYGIVKKELFLRYDPSLRTILFSNGTIFISTSGIIDGFVDGNYWLMKKPNQWQTFGDRVIRIEHDNYQDDPYPKFSLVIRNVLNTKGLVLDEKLLKELVKKYGSLEQLISIYMAVDDPELKELIAKALNVMEPFSYDLLIASVRLPNPEDVENILNKNDLLRARSLSLEFASTIRLATREEAEIINNLSSTD